MFDRNELKKIAEEKARWNSTEVKKVLSKSKERKEKFTTSSDIEILNLYTPDQIADVDYTGYLGMPGEYPFTRGVYPTMYRGKPWTMRQYAGFGTAEESNKRYKYLLQAGQTGLSVAFDLPTQMGYDSDHALSQGEVGKVGVAIDSLADMEVLFDGIPLDQVSTSMTINAPASVLLCMYMAVAEKQGVTFDQLSGTIQNDILKEYVARGTYIFPPNPSLRIITDIFEFCSKNLPKWNTISISGYHIREAGSTAVQEVAFTLANGMEYVDRAIKAGLNVDDFAPRLSFFFNSQMNLLEEVAKFRAARRIWAKVMKERFGAKDPKSWMLRFHTKTAGSALTAQQPMNNIVRVTLQALAAALGGTQSLHTNSFDEALGLPTEESVRIALRTKQIIAYESGAADTIDPLGGAYYIETLTNQIEEEVMKYFKKVEELGGMAKAIEMGYVQNEIQDSAYKYQRAVESQKEIVVGVNQFTIKAEEKPEILKVDPQLEVRQVERLKTLKAKRNQAKVDAALLEIKKAAEGADNLLTPIYNAVKEYATLGEICGVLRKVYGEYQATSI